jgi:hypothetical protein
MSALFSRSSLNGTLVVGTDGLFSYASVANVAEAVRGHELASAAEELLALVQLRSGAYQDDVGLAVVAPATRWAG